MHNTVAKKRQMFSRAALLGVMSLASACATMAPEYERPASPVADALPNAEDSATASLVSWRSVFTDPALQALIETALRNNRDLRVSALTVDRARTLYRIQRADSLPAVGVGGDYSRQRFGENASTLGAAGASSGQGPITVEQYSATANVSAYELDLFGRVRSLNRQALNTYLATEQAKKAAEVSLIAEVTRAYLQLAADRKLLAIARDTIETQKSSLALTRNLADNGLGNDVDVERVRTSIERARADIAALEAQVKQDENALQLLLGSTSDLTTASAQSINGIEINNDFAVGASSDALLQRPDILAAENRLIAANASIGAARAAFMPRILLTASAGTASAELSDLFAPGTGVWRFAPSISIPIFTGGRNRAQLQGAKIDRDIAQAEYEGAIQTAFRETADALAIRATINERYDAVSALANASARVFELTSMRYENGIDDYFAVLDAQRASYAAQQELVVIELAKTVNTVQLFRALGGGSEGAGDFAQEE